MEVRGPANPHEVIGADGGHAELGTAGGHKVGDGDRPGPRLGFAEINAVNLHNPSAGGIGGGIPRQLGTTGGGVDGHGQGGRLGGSGGLPARGSSVDRRGHGKAVGEPIQGLTNRLVNGAVLDIVLVVTAVDKGVQVGPAHEIIIVAPQSGCVCPPLGQIGDAGTERANKRRRVGNPTPPLGPLATLVPRIGDARRRQLGLTLRQIQLGVAEERIKYHSFPQVNRQFPIGLPNDLRALRHPAYEESRILALFDALGNVVHRVRHPDAHAPAVFERLAAADFGPECGQRAFLIVHGNRRVGVLLVGSGTELVKVRGDARCLGPRRNLGLESQAFDAVELPAGAAGENYIEVGAWSAGRWRGLR